MAAVTFRVNARSDPSAIVPGASGTGNPSLHFNDSFPEGKLAVLLAMYIARYAYVRWSSSKAIG